jgi:ABC-type molybdate transport system substrate-binding protein
LPPITLAAPIEQQAVALKASHAPAAALAFLRWLRTDAQAAKRLRAAGYRLP